MVRRGLLPVLAPAAVLLLLLTLQLPADPAEGVTFSSSPFTDEGWNALAARNWVLLGDPATGNWVLHLVQLPFTALEAASFSLFGVGIIQARLVAMAACVTSVAALGLLVRQALGSAAGIVAAAMLSGSTLVLYYGRLVYLEDLVMLALVGGSGLLCSMEPGTSRTRAVLAGLLLAVAIGTKPSAAFAVAGIIGGVAITGRSRRILQHALTALGTVLAAGLGWLLVVALPHGSQIERVLEIWAEESLPSSLAELGERIAEFPTYDGVLGWAWPLVVGAGVGTVSIVVLWRELNAPQRRLVGAAGGWLLIGLAFLLVASYRPNRYVVPVLPPLAVLAAYVVPLARRSAGVVLPRWLAAAAVAAGVAGLLLPGLLSYRSWESTSSQRLPQLQERFAHSMDSQPIQGGMAATLAMRVPAPIYVDWATSQLNSGDLYAESGVRWLVETPEFTPSWWDRHPTAWQRRTTLFCATWGRADRCLVHLP